MIIALEGPDGVGKTTCFEALRASGRFPRAKFVGVKGGRAVERACTDMWRALYDHDTLYICDRFCAVSDNVYSKLHGRPVESSREGWQPEVRLLLLRLPVDELRRRLRERGESELEAWLSAALTDLYETERLHWVNECVDASRPLNVLMDQVSSYIDGWMHVAQRR